jgi:hypothetical protein
MLRLRILRWVDYPCITKVDPKCHHKCPLEAKGELTTERKAL